MSITVVGSVNLDLVAGVAQLPQPGETILGTALARHPGGKGANQALAARRLGAEVQLVAAVGVDADAEAALALLRADGVDLTRLATREDVGTGVALIAVAASGENQIIVVPGANATLSPQDLPGPGQQASQALIGVLEVPVETVAAVVAAHPGFICLNLAPAIPVPDILLTRPDLIVVNETELAFYGTDLLQRPGATAVTLGAAGARLVRAGVELAACAPPPVTVVDTVGAGDTFVAALTVALLEGQEPARALRFACAASALAVTRAGAQPSLPARAEVDRLVALEDW